VLLGSASIIRASAVLLAAHRNLSETFHPKWPLLPTAIVKSIDTCQMLWWLDPSDLGSVSHKNRGFTLIRFGLCGRVRSSRRYKWDEGLIKIKVVTTDHKVILVVSLNMHLPAWLPLTSHNSTSPLPMYLHCRCLMKVFPWPHPAIW
jgi:hypothetical protein